MIASISAATLPLIDFPHTGAARDTLAPGLRVVFRAPYAIYFRMSGELVVIMRVLHGARDAAAAFNNP